MNRFVGWLEEIEILLHSFNAHKETLNVVKGRHC